MHLLRKAPGKLNPSGVFPVVGRGAQDSDSFLVTSLCVQRDAGEGKNDEKLKASLPVDGDWSEGGRFVCSI